MWKALLTFIVGIVFITHIPACKNEVQFGSDIKKFERSDGVIDLSNPNDPDNPGNSANPDGKTPGNTNIGSENQVPDGKPNPNDPNDPDNPGFVPGGSKGPVVPGGGGTTGCVDANGDEKAATLTNFPTNIQSCIRGDLATRGLYNFATSTCEKVKFASELTCSKEVLRAAIVDAGMSAADFDANATSESVFFAGGCGKINMPSGHTAVILQFFKLGKAAYDPATCTYNVTGGSVVTGCYITATDSSWASLDATAKVARCFREAPRK